MSTYRKFSDARRVEALTLEPPKPPKAPNPILHDGDTLGAVGALGGAKAQSCNSEPEVTAFDRVGTWGQAEEERAAIVEFDGNIPRQWAEGFARLDPDRPPVGVPLKLWQRFVDDVGLFLDSPFCAVATALGWGAYDLFGCDRDRPFTRLDMMGLIWLVNGAKLVALTDETATVELATGSRQTYYRRPVAAGTVLVWELVQALDDRSKSAMRPEASPSTPTPPSRPVISRPAIIGEPERIGYSDCGSAANE